MSLIYLLAMHGGFEAASFQSFTDRVEAQKAFDHAVAETMWNDGDVITLLSTDGTTTTVISEVVRAD